MEYDIDVDAIYEKFSVVYGDDLMPHYRLKNYRSNTTDEVLDLGESSQEVKEKSRKIIEDMLKRRADTFTNGVDLFKNFMYVDIDNLEKSVTGWDYFDKPQTFELLNLVSSIESIGLITPLIVKTKDYESFTIICGNSRFAALKNICKYKNEVRFRNVPCFVLDDPVDEYLERSLIIDDNLRYRKISKEVYIKAILEKHAMIKKIKTYRNEVNIAESVAAQMSISDATVFNYLTLQKLCNEAMTLVYEKKLKLGPARMLAKLSHENQLYILENAKLEDINAVHKLKVLVQNPKASLSEIEMKTEFIQDFVPQSTEVTITVNKEALKELFNNIIDFKEFIFTNLSGTVAEKKLKDMVKVKVNKEHIRFYVQHNFIDGSLIEKVTGKNLDEILAV